MVNFLTVEDSLSRRVGTRNLQWEHEHPVNYLTIGAIMWSDTAGFNKVTPGGRIRQGFNASEVFVVLAEEK